MNHDERMSASDLYANLMIMRPHLAIPYLGGHQEAAYKEGYQKGLEDAANKLDEKWNCNCLTDKSLGLDVCTCVGSPANTVRALMENESD